MPQQVEFFIGDDNDTYWRVLDANGDIVNRSSEGFTQSGGAKNNLLIFHTLLSTDLLAIANYHAGYPEINPLSNLEFYEDDQLLFRWRVKAGNGEIVGAAHRGFSDGGEVKNNVLMTYSLISTYLASIVKGD